MATKKAPTTTTTRASKAPKPTIAVAADCVAWSRGALAIGTASQVALFSSEGVTFLKAAGQRLLRTLAVSDDASVVVVGMSSKTALVHRDGAVQKLVGKKIGAAGLVAVSRDGDRAIHARVIWDDAGKEVGRGLAWLSTFTANDAVVIATGDHEDKTLRRVAVDGRALHATTLPGAATCLSAAVDVDAYAVGLGDGTAAIFDGAAPDAPVIVKFLDDYEILSIAVSPDGRRVAAGGYIAARPEGEAPTGGVRIYSTTLRRMEGAALPFDPPSERHGIAFSANGARVAALVPSGAVRITDLEDHARFWEVYVGEKDAWCVRAHDGRVEGPGVVDVVGTAATGVLREALG